MTMRPDLVVRFAHYLEQRWRAEHVVNDVDVRARMRVSLNGRRPSYMIDPERNQTTADWDLRRQGGHCPFRPGGGDSGRARYAADPGRHGLAQVG